MVRFYGEHSSMWVRLEDLTAVELTNDSHLDRLSAMRAHPKLKHKYVLSLWATCACQSYGGGRRGGKGVGWGCCHGYVLCCLALSTLCSLSVHAQCALSLCVQSLHILLHNSNKFKYTTTMTIKMSFKYLQAVQGTVGSKHTYHDDLVHYKRSITRIEQCCHKNTAAAAGCHSLASMCSS